MRHRSLDRETGEVDVTVIAAPRHKDAVLLLHDDTGDEQWVPKSLIDDADDLEEGDVCTVEIAIWKLEQMGWA